MIGRPRTYAFGDLAIGDRIVVPLNGREPGALAASITVAAQQYARTHDAGFRFSVSRTALPGFVTIERIGAGRGRTALLIDADRARMARLDRVSRERPLASQEIDRLKRTALRLQRRAA